jgi:predicted ATPase
VTVGAMPNRDRIVRVRFSGLRTAADVQLDCEPMTVLIGPNGVGKSTLIEGLEILRKIVSSSDFVRMLNDEHGGVSHLMRHGESELKLGVDITDGSSRLSYAMILARRNGSFTIEHESLHHEGEAVFVRDGERFVAAPAVAPQLSPGYVLMKWPLLVPLSPASPLVARVTTALAGIEVHVPFATQARWFGPGMVPERNMRADSIVQSTDRLDRGGTNLANAFHALRNRPDWADTLETIRLVVDGDITDVTTPASASGGNIGLAVSYRTSGSVPAFALSDGTLALLALIAIVRLDDGDTPRSLLVLDEPDLHLHPGAIGQVVALLEECSAHQSVVIATHSDHLLDSLSEPARATVLCDLDEQRRLRLRRPDRTQLDRWLEEYRGLGHLRAEGYDKLVFPPPRISEKA